VRGRLRGIIGRKERESATCTGGKRTEEHFNRKFAGGSERGEKRRGRGQGVPDGFGLQRLARELKKN